MPEPSPTRRSTMKGFKEFLLRGNLIERLLSVVGEHDLEAALAQPT